MMAASCVVVGVDGKRHLLRPPAHALAERARRREADMARRRRKEHEADHVGAGIERHLERLGRLQAADFDKRRHMCGGSTARRRSVSPARH